MQVLKRQNQIFGVFLFAGDLQVSVQMVYGDGVRRAHWTTSFQA